MSLPLLSVIVPVFGTEKYLKRCLDSILNQSYKNLEVIVVDDCSPDNSAEIISEYCKRDSRVHVAKHEKNKGLFQARVTGSELATGEYIAFVDSDDHISIDFYRELINCAEEGEFDIVAGNTVRENDAGGLSQLTLHKICFGEHALYGEEVRNAFFSQDAACYAWHTIWNKIYRKTLWDKCVPEYRLVTEHLIMTEDIAFSSILFYNANSFTHVDSNSCYFYFANENASTNSAAISFHRFEKNVEDIILVFNFVDAFLKREGATPEICRHFTLFRKHYYKMWRDLQRSSFALGEHSKRARAIVSELGKEFENDDLPADLYCDSLISNAYPHIEKIKNDIASEEIVIVSFDIFDTLLLRPVWNPDDVFDLMQVYFEQICPDYRNTSFKRLRQTAENQSRSELYYSRPSYEDVTIAEIYEEFSKITGIALGDARKLQAYEENLELSLIQTRKTGFELFDFAKACNKKIVLISDMYLHIDTVEAMLHKCGYTGYSHLFLSSQERLIKHTGNLFSYAANELNVKPSRILHIGDNWESDISTAQKRGYQTAFLPKTRDRFCDTIPGVPTNLCASIGCMVGGSLTTWDKLFDSIGFRAMMALVANKAFDNPYTSWNAGSDFDVNPYFMGYYAVGMHLIGVCKWLAGIIKRRGISHISFLGRDGYLPIKVMEIAKNFFDIENISMNYVPCSRLSVLPWMIEDKHGLLNLPIEYRAHTPLSIIKLLKDFCWDVDEGELTQLIKQNGFLAEKHFTTEKEYYQYITWLRDNLFDEQKLGVAKNAVSAYYRDMIPEGSLVFDLGYSGRIPVALQKSLQYPVVFAYVHQDNAKFSAYCRTGNLDTELMYDFVPQFSGLIREYFLSEVGNSCVGLIRVDSKIKPVFADTDVPYVKRVAFEHIAEGACQFTRDFITAFNDLKECMDFDPVQVSMPFEGLVHVSRLEDRKVFSASASDDTVHGQNNHINMSKFWINQINRTVIPEGGGFAMADYAGCVQMVAYGKSKFAKVIIYALCDRGTLKWKVKERLSGHPALLAILRKTYKAIKIVFKRR